MKHNNLRTISDMIEEYRSFLGPPSSRESVTTMKGYVEDFFEEQLKVTCVGSIGEVECRKFATHLNHRSQQGELSKGSVLTYYRYFKAWLKYCQEEGVIDRNPAITKRARKPLPDSANNGQQQFWPPEFRERFLRALDREAQMALDEIDGPNWSKPFRNRAFGYVTAFAANRATEIVAQGGDPERNGVRWRDIDLDDQTAHVLGKQREYEFVQLPDPAIDVLEEYKIILNPPHDGWPVFPTDHRPTLAADAREQLAEEGLSETEREEVLGQHTSYEVYREFELTPASITYDGIVSVLYDIFEEYDLEIDGERPELHAARRGMGDTLYRENPVLAQEALRHASIDTTHEAYSHLKASETAKEVTEIVGAEPPRFVTDGMVEENMQGTEMERDPQSTRMESGTSD